MIENNPIRPTTSPSGISTPQSTPPTPPPLPPVSEPSQAKGFKPSTKEGLNPEKDQQRILSLTEEVSARALATQEKRLPALQNLDKQLDTKRQNLISESTQHNKHELAKTVLVAHPQRQINDFKAGSLVAQYQDQLKPLNLSDMVSSRFGDVEKSLRGKLLGKSTKNTAFEKAQNMAKGSVMGSQFKSEFLLKLATMGESQLKDEIAKGIGASRSERYGNDSGYAQLSERKQKLVDAIFNGYQEGLRAVRPELTLHMARQMSESLQSQIQAAEPNSKLVFDLSLKSQTDFAKEVATGLGLLKEGENLDSLTPKHRQMVDSMARELATVTRASLPNKASQTSVQIGDNLEAPTTITLNGKTYGTPEFLGKGGLGAVMKYTNLSDPNDKVVIKSLLDPNQREEMVKEAQSHRFAMGEDLKGHPNVVGLRGMVSGANDSLYMVMDLAGGGDIKGISSSLDFASTSDLLPEKAKLVMVQHLFSQVVNGMDYVQSQNMLHLDIKDENFLLDDSGRVQVADFGSAQRSSTLDPNTSRVATTYKPMEWETKNTLTQKTDTYQIGRMLYVMLGGKSGVGLVSPGTERQQELTKRGLDPESFVQKSAPYELMTAMLDHDPNQRPSLEGVKSHSFLQDYDPDNDKNKALVTAMMDYHKNVGSKLKSLNSKLGKLDTEHKNINTTIERKQQILLEQQDLQGQILRLKNSQQTKQYEKALQTAAKNLN